HDAARYRDLLEEDVLDVVGRDELGDLVDLLTPARLIARLLERLGRHEGPRTLEDRPHIAAEGHGGRGVDGDAVAHTSPPESRGAYRATRVSARRDYNAALSKFV